MIKFFLYVAAALAVSFSATHAATTGSPSPRPSPPGEGVAAAAVATAAGVQPSSDLYAAGQWRLSPFASYRVHKFGEFDGKFGGGLSLSYAPAQNVAIELETISEAVDDSHWADAFTEAGVNFKGYLPLGATGLAPYGLIGYTRDLQDQGSAGASPSRNRMNAGAGIAWRFGRHAELFADGRWTHNFRDLGHALFRGGVSIGF